MLSIQINNKKQNLRFEHSGGSLEFGRGPKRKSDRFVINDLFTSRDQLRIEERPGGRLFAENLSLKQEVVVGDVRIGIGDSREIALPARFVLGQTAVDVEAVSAETFNKQALQSVEQGGREEPQQIATLIDIGGVPPPDQFTQWLEAVVSLQKSAAEPKELYAQTARALVDLIGLDSGMVLLRHEWSWEPVAQYPEIPAANFSRTLLAHVAAERRTFYQDLKSFSAADSLRGIEAVVVSPVFGPRDEVIGALYGVRTRTTMSRGGIRPLEAQVVQLLAAAVGAHMTRALASRTRSQFEQAFSVDVVRELEREPELLEGRSVDVALLSAGLHGFGRIAERLGPREACQLVRDVLDRFTERLAEHGAVVVEYQDAGLLAMWNAPLPQPDPAIAAAGAALALLSELPEINARWQSKAGESLSFGFGLHSGATQVGNMGCSTRFKYAPHGPAVRLVRRLQDASAKLGRSVLLTGPVQNQLPDTMATRRLCQARFAGFKDPVALYELHGVKGSEDWVARRDAYESALMLYEFGQWAKACQTLVPLVKLAEQKEHHDPPTFMLMRLACKCLEAPPDPFDPVIDLE